MATIRAAMIAGAAFVSVYATVPAQAQSRQTTAAAPLQLVPGADQATRAGKPGKTTNTAKAAVKKTAIKKTARKNAKKEVKAATAPRSTKRFAQPTKNVRTATTAAPRLNSPRVRAVQNRPAQRAIATALPEVREQDNHEPLAFAPMPSQQAVRVRAPANQAARDQAPRDHVMRDGDSVSLIGRLPWWRNNPLQPIHYGSKEAESQVVAAADAWLLASSTVVAEPNLSGDKSVVIADAGEFNAIDHALASVPTPAAPMFWHSLIAILGGAAAAAAAAAASARFMFT